MLNKFLVLLLCFYNSNVFSNPTYCFANNTDLDVEIGFTSETRIQQLCGDEGRAEGNKITIAPDEAVLIVSIRDLNGYQQLPSGYEVKEEEVDPVSKYWGGFQDKSNLAPFRKMYGKNINRAFLVTEDTPGASANSSCE